MAAIHSTASVESGTSPRRIGARICECQRGEALLGCVEAREVGGADAGGGLGGREALELGADQECLADLGGGDRPHAHAAVGDRGDEAERLEALERLAHRCAADAEALAHVLLAQDLPGRDLPEMISSSSARAMSSALVESTDTPTTISADPGSAASRSPCLGSKWPLDSRHIRLTLGSKIASIFGSRVSKER